MRTLRVHLAAIGNNDYTFVTSAAMSYRIFLKRTTAMDCLSRVIQPQPKVIEEVVEVVTYVRSAHSSEGRQVTPVE
jgi:hypothetical protein